LNAIREMKVRDNVSGAEWQARVDLAAMYRLTALFHWDDLVFTHISMRVPGPEHHFLINPYGFLFEEITASSLVKVDLAGNIVMNTPYFINPAGFTIHGAIHEARADALCVYHTHTLHGVAVSAQKEGLLPISQHSLLPLSSIGYHTYEGLALNADERPRLIRDLGSNQALILRNHGLLTVGRSAAETFLLMYMLESSCRIQVMAKSGGSELTQIGSTILSGIRSQVDVVTKGMGADILWPGLLRRLDRLDKSYKE
jgi:ribulose-5-phosphate 4-epimerase/fuculose-1-phosphate aldolase